MPKLRSLVLPLALVVATLAGGWYGYRYLTHGRFVESTDDAYVRADKAAVAARIAGYADAIAVADNQRVSRGDLLVSIEAGDYETKLAQARAVVASREAAVSAIDARLSIEAELVEAARARLASAKADVTRAEADLKRAEELRASGSGTAQRYDAAVAEARKARAAADSAAAALSAEEQQRGVLATQKAQAQADLAQAQAQLAQAELDLSHTRIVAPFDGVVANKSVEAGQYVRAGQQLMVVVPLPDVYVVANFKETQAGHMRRGQAVEVEVDAFEGKVFTGRIESFAPATGSEFALIPPENATGNFTKIVQRLPVRIALDAHPDLALLRPGMSVTASVDTRHEGLGPDSRLGALPRPEPVAGR